MPKATTYLTDILEVIGILLITAGIFIAFGLAAALIAAGVLALGISFLIASRGGRR